MIDGKRKLFPFLLQLLLQEGLVVMVLRAEVGFDELVGGREEGRLRLKNLVLIC